MPFSCSLEHQAPGSKGSLQCLLSHQADAEMGALWSGSWTSVEGKITFESQNISASAEKQPGPDVDYANVLFLFHGVHVPSFIILLSLQTLNN